MPMIQEYAANPVAVARPIIQEHAATALVNSMTINDRLNRILSRIRAPEVKPAALGLKEPAVGVLKDVVVDTLSSQTYSFELLSEIEELV
jgi:hypothetical protein